MQNYSYYVLLLLGRQVDIWYFYGFIKQVNQKEISIPYEHS
jgi:hypothetical protein